MLALLDDLKSRGVGFRSLTEALDTTGPLGQAMITIIAAFNQLERDTNIERTRAGLQAARERGKRGGRPRALDDQKVKVARLMYESGNPVSEIARTLGVGVATIYRCLPQRTERTASA